VRFATGSVLAMAALYLDFEYILPVESGDDEIPREDWVTLIAHTSGVCVSECKASTNPFSGCVL
jgi:hypothetical protein